MRIAVVGAGEMGCLLLNSLNEIKQDLDLTLVERNTYTFRKYLLAPWLLDAIPDRDFFLDPAQVCEGFRSANMITDTLERINFPRKTLFFKEHDKLEVDTVILCCGVTPKRLGFTGEHKGGIYYFGALKNPFEFKQRLKMFDHVVLQVSTSYGVQVALALKKYDLDMKILLHSSGQHEISEFLQQRGCDVLSDSTIIEAFGDSEVRAVKLNSGKIIAADLVFIDTGITANLEVFEASGESMNNPAQSLVSENLMTRFEGCLACGEMIESLGKKEIFSYHPEVLKAQAETCLSYLKGEKKIYPYDTICKSWQQFLDELNMEFPVSIRQQADCGTNDT